MDLLTFVANFGLIVTILSFFTAIEICVVIWKQKSSEGIPAFPLIAGFLCSALWLNYGVCNQDEMMIKINMIGVGCFTSYLLFYYVFARMKSKISGKLLISLAFLGSLILAPKYTTDESYFVGLAASAFTVVLAVSPMDSVLAVTKQKSTEDLPFLFIFSSFLVNGSWFAYGLLLKDLFLIIPNGIGFFISTLQLSLFLIFPHKKVKVQ